ncbi:NOTCH1 [Branchiostoma lanceolatum]|uniref:NOTCH1 protein n=1 Tax=Branchiostoma lanceolatum TaxID=7740 RepID=A0A8J9YUU7_BRALA|nr:NOTCH1 [Branchiostoma lanceolatum]
MTSDNVMSTCQRAGMDLPCYYTGGGSCVSSYWNSNCISFDRAYPECRTASYLSYILCGTHSPSSSNCPILNGIVVYRGSSTSTITYTSSNYDQDALCAAPQCQNSQCLNGKCVVYGFNSQVCWCDDGWTGVNCDAAVVGSCSSSPCKSGGTCQDDVNGYTCVCPPNATGRNCETVLHADTCYWFSDDSLSNQEASSACDNMGGHLASIQETAQQQLLANSMNPGGVESYWTANKISPLSCGAVAAAGSSLSGTKAATWMHNNGDVDFDICVLLDSTVGYMGTYQSCNEQHNYICETNVSPCQSHVCQNGGNCYSCYGDSNTFCICPQGYSGTLCETVNLCDSNPCPFDWTCVNQVGGIHCAVPTGMKAARSSFCTTTSCGPGWTCIEDGPAGYSCTRA